MLCVIFRVFLVDLLSLELCMHRLLCWSLVFFHPALWRLCKLKHSAWWSFREHGAPFRHAGKYLLSVGELMTSRASDWLCSVVWTRQPVACLLVFKGRTCACARVFSCCVQCVVCVGVGGWESGCQSATWDSCFPFPSQHPSSTSPPPPSPLLHLLFLLVVWQQSEADGVADGRLDVLLIKWIRWIPADELGIIGLF